VIPITRRRSALMYHVI